MPTQVTLVNVSGASGSPHPPSVECLVGDACDAIALVGSRRFDLVYSNSTIEHVGGHSRCQMFAESVRALAPRHWIQTPYRYFPLEPHFLFPGFQFLPLALRASIIQRWPLSYGKSRGETIDDPVGTVADIELLGRTQLQYYFPDSRILSEKVLGLTKSIIAVATSD